MAFLFGRDSRKGELSPKDAVEKLLTRMRNDCTEARFQVLAAEADLRGLEAQVEGLPSEEKWSKELLTHRKRVFDLRAALGHLEKKTKEAEVYAGALVAIESSLRARLSLDWFLAELESGEAVEVFERLKEAVQLLEFESQGLGEVRDLLS